MLEKEVHSNFNKFLILLMKILCLISPVLSFASDPSTLYWPFILGLALLGLLLFIVSCVLIMFLFDNTYVKTLFIGFFFGIFLGPAYLPNGNLIINIANLFFGKGQDSFFLAFSYATGYAIMFVIIFHILVKALNIKVKL